MSPDLDDRDLDVQRALRDHLTRRAAAVDPSLAPVALVTRRARARERRQVLVAAVAVAAVTVGGTAVVAPWLTGSTQGQVATDPGPDGRWAPDEVPTRGDLADDATFRAGARDALRRELATIETAAKAAGEPVGDTGRATLGHVVFAGRLPAGAAVVATLEEAPEQVLTFWSPTGRAADLAVQPTAGRFYPPSTVRDEVAVTVGGPDGPGYAVVVPLRAGTRSVEISTGPVIGADASVRRTWDALPLVGGAAVGTLDGRHPIELPVVRLDDGPARLVVPARRVNTQEQVDTFTRDTIRGWGIGSTPAAPAVGAGLQSLLDAVPVGRLDVEPVFHGRQQPSTADVVAGLARLDDGTVLQFAGAFDDRADRTQASTTYIAGRAVAPAATGRTPFTWIDDVSYSQSATDEPTMRARARMALPGAVRMEVRDVGRTPCGPSRAYGSADVDANGLGTVVVDIPPACRDAVPAGVPRTMDTYRDIVAVALDAQGREIGRASLQPASMYDLPDTLDYLIAQQPDPSSGTGG